MVPLRRAWLLASLVLAAPVAGCSDDDGDGDSATGARDDGGPGASPAERDAGAGAADAATGQAPGASTGEPPRPMDPIDEPVADDCITEVAPGDHTFTCNGLTFHVMVDEICTRFACGLIFDVHGGTMAGVQMRDNTQLHELGPPAGYLVVHPSATPNPTGGFWTPALYPDVADFMFRMIDAFHVDADRVHFTGFSQGGQMTWHFVCTYPEVLASAAPVAATPSCIDEGWAPPHPLLYMQGVTDGAFSIASSRSMIARLTELLALEPDEEEGDGHYTRASHTGADGMVLDYIEHDYGGQAVLGGHCIPGGIDIPGAANNFGLNATTCTTGEIGLHWGEVALQWFIDHPRGGAP